MATSLLAQSSTGSISGTVTDDSGAALPGVSITATNASTGASRTVVTNSAGSYTFALLPPAKYSVETQLEGFQPMRRENVTVNVGSDVALNVTLKP
ncbi:MAG TPA: carboxypeptidase-like regulatory domain-containing protein, partial [Thermoanaerobaculia bacterium]|nr:carboxypeptidase-like regulatory domain-containing protein [Thermoanaerobaculia bacterium]